MFTYTDPKSRLGSIQTPLFVARFLHKILKHLKPTAVLDPAVGEGNLLIPWRETAITLGVDTDEDRVHIATTVNKISSGITMPFENTTREDYPVKPELVMCNPPWNRHWNNLNYPEVFLQKIVELFGNKIPICLLCPMGLRLNQTAGSPRKRWIKNTLEINSIISCPRDLYPETEFHSEIILFNCKKVRPHYWMIDPPEKKDE